MKHTIYTILHSVKSFEPSILKIMKYGFYFSLFFCILATAILIVYITIYTLSDLFYIGFSILKSGIFFAVSFLICGFVFDKIQKDFS